MTKSKTIAEIVTEDYRTAEVFRRYGLDFCCGGNRTMPEACERKGINLTELEQALSTISRENEPVENYNEWGLGFLADYIINTHHSFVNRKLPEIHAYATKVATVHGDRHPEVKKVAQLFTQLSSELSGHLQKEEQVLFPYIKELEQTKNSGACLLPPPFGSAQNPIRLMEAEHELAGQLMENIRSLTDNYTPPADACNTYRVLFANLEAFEKDLHKHVHLENNILFPKAIAMEAR